MAAISDPPIEKRLAGMAEPDLADPDNPEWTAEDFARAVGPDALSETELQPFRRRGVGRQRTNRRRR